MTRPVRSRGGRLRQLLRRAPTLLRTVRHLRARQALAQIHHALFGLARPRSAGPATPRLAIPAPATPWLPPPAHVKALPPDRFELLATAFEPPSGEGWSRSSHGPLFAYHLHQQEYLRLPDVPPARRAAVIADWIASHRAGIGWDPHPTGLRLLAWGKLFTTAGGLPDDPALREAMLRSFADQAATLAHGLEFRLQANHLLSNLIGVVYAGLLVDAPAAEAWRSRATLLLDELARQVHPDGGHEERSPMYHASLLEALLDLLNLCRAAPARAPYGLEAGLVRVLPRMVDALERLSHGDGRIALFADSAFDLAAEPAALRDYAVRLGLVEPAAPARDRSGLPALTAPGSARLSDTGYVRLASPRWLLIASVAGPAPAHQPGHAHCDALAFELSLDGRRLVTDTGVREYVPGPWRTHARATASHATLQIDDEEQAEIWAAHRVGGRPAVVVTAFDAALGVAEATCRGWSRPDTLHRRRFRVGGREVEIVDSVEGPARRITSRLPLAPGVTVELRSTAGPGTDGPAGGFARCRAGDVGGPAIEIELPTGFAWRVETAACHPSFGRTLERPVLVGVGRACIDARTIFRLLD
ncbi:MAG: heparinase II/III family protein [Myxococcota bacterium]